MAKPEFVEVSSSVLCRKRPRVKHNLTDVVYDLARNNTGDLMQLCRNVRYRCKVEEHDYYMPRKSLKTSQLNVPGFNDFNAVVCSNFLCSYALLQLWDGGFRRTSQLESFRSATLFVGRAKEKLD